VLVVVTEKMSKGIARQGRGMPTTGHMRSEIDERGLHILRIYPPDNEPKPLWPHLILPQLVDVRKRSMLLRGFERREGQMFAQAWVVEPVMR
jgi:hypothetical protein